VGKCDSLALDTLRYPWRTLCGNYPSLDVSVAINLEQDCYTGTTAL
jgi:hypothetical protein